ncbi:MAG TPA: transposase [Rickettsia endosymbiont of Sericostoma sp.]|nr:transposase [Rickettsia endosymbiont of Sericostoma sp.]
MSAKLHLAMTTSWHIIEGFLTAGNRNDIAVVEELTADIVGCDVIQDRGYDSNKNRPNLESQNNITVIPGRKNRKTEIVYDREKYKLRGDVVAFLDLFVNLRSSSLIDVDHIQVLNFPV